MFELVENWRQLWKANSVQFMLAALLAPEFLEFLASNLSIFPWGAEHKETIRVALIAAAMILRYRKQPTIGK